MKITKNQLRKVIREQVNTRDSGYRGVGDAPFLEAIDVKNALVDLVMSTGFASKQNLYDYFERHGWGPDEVTKALQRAWK